MTDTKNKDIHGRDRLAKNTLINWVVLCVKFISGFILPRLVNDTIGQESLGIWDFAWSIVGYFELVTAGVISSINRYVAKYRSAGDDGKLIGYVSTAGYVVRGMSALVIALSVILLLIPAHTFGAASTSLWHEARWPVFLLGIGIAVQISASVYNGVLTGFHRWDIHNGIQIGTLVLMLLTSVVVLLSGGGLTALALGQISSEFIGRVGQIIASKKIYPQLKIQRKYFRLDTAKKILVFGSKTYVNVIARLISVQTVNILIGGALGPALLAIYSRPHSLMRQLGNIIEKYAMVLVPTISSLQNAKETSGIQKIAVSSTIVAIMISLPMVMLLIFLGKDILTLWMGGAFGVGFLMAIVAIGGLFEMATMPLYRILMGMNLHGRVVAANLGASIVASICAFIVIGWMHRGILAVGLATTIPVIIAHGIVVPIISSKALGFAPVRFLYDVWKKPIPCVLPFVILLGFVRSLEGLNPLARIAIAISCGGIVLGITYWIGIVPSRVKKRLAARFTFSHTKA